MTAIAIFTLTIGFSAQVAFWIRGGQWVRGIFGLLFVTVYWLDLSYSALTQSFFVAEYQGRHVAHSDDLRRVGAVVLIAWLTFAIFSAPGRFWRRDQKRVEYQNNISMGGRGRPIVGAIAGLASSIPILAIARSSGVEAVLNARQQALDGNLLALVCYFALPALVPFLAVLFFEAHDFLVRCLLVLTIVVDLTAILLSGSRSSLILALTGLAIVLFRFSVTRRSFGVLASRNFVIAVLAASPAILTGWYISRFRGASSATSPFGGPDISQVDVLASLLQTPVPELQSTYPAAFLWFVPRSMWPSKPYSGNVAVSEILTPDRYSLTGAQTTSGLIGEAFINAGFVLSGVIAGLLLAIVVRVLGHLSSSKDVAVWALAVVLLLRCFNLLRGDAVNVVTPVMIGLLAWICLFQLRNRNLLRVR